MNIDRIQHVRDVIAAAPATMTDMSKRGQPSTGTSCGTPGCIVGWVNHLYPPAPVTAGAPSIDYFRDAYAQLDLSFAQGQSLSLGAYSTWEIRQAEIPRRAVLSVLDHLIETGEVNWTRVGYADLDGDYFRDGHTQ